MTTWLYTLASVVFVGTMSLLGVIGLSVDPARLERVSLTLVAIAAGGLLGDAFLHLLPESLEQIGSATRVFHYVMSGLLLFFVLEKMLRWRRFEVHRHHVRPIVAINIVGDGLHNIIDGMLIAASYLFSLSLGITTTIAVVMHEIPQELGDFGILIHGGLSVRRALLYNFLSALSAVLGAVIVLLVGQRAVTFTETLIPITAGGFLYLALSDLVPELMHKDSGPRASLEQFAWMLLGVAVMTLL